MKILFMGAQPKQEVELRLGEEVREIRQKLQLAKQRERFDLTERWAVRPGDVVQHMLDVEPNIVHFSGHGAGTPGLCFESVTGRAQLVPAPALRSLFAQFSDQVKCVVLNACYSEEQAKAIVEQIPFVIGMNDSVDDAAAVAFATGFYQGVGAGRSVQSAYELGKVQIQMHGVPDADVPVLLVKPGVDVNAPFDLRPSTTPEPELVDGRQLLTHCVMRTEDYFTGRENDLAALRAALTAGGEAGVTQAIAGLGGVGKSSLARAYVRRHLNDYKAVFFVNASSITSVVASYRVIDRQFSAPVPEGTNDEVLVESVLRQLNAMTGYLLVLDNADFGRGYTASDLKPYLPERKGNYWLITSRTPGALHSLGVTRNAVRTLEELEPDEAVRLLWESVNGKDSAILEDEKPILQKLSQALHNFPLALAQAAAYTAETGTDYSKDLRIYAAAERALPEPPSLLDEDNDDQIYRKAIGTTWQVNLNALKQSGAKASVELIYLSSFLAPDDIPVEVILYADQDDISSLFSEHIVSDSLEDIEVAFDRLIDPLIRYGLAIKKDSKFTYSIHRLTHRVLRDSLDTGKKLYYAELSLDALDSAFPDVSVNTWLACSRLAEHIQFIRSRMTTLNIMNSKMAKIYNNIAFFFVSQGRYAEAERLYKEALDIDSKLDKVEPQELSAHKHNLSELYRITGRIAESIHQCVEALYIRRSYLPENHIDISESINTLGLLYNIQGNADDAEKLLVSSLAITRSSFPKNHPDIGIALNNMAYFYKVQNRLDEAKPLFS